MDVINMSLGSDFAEPNDPSAISSQRASDLGIVVVASSGNAGAVPYVTGAPADAPSAISVAASIPGGRVYSRVSVTAPASVAGTKNNLEGCRPCSAQGHRGGLRYVDQQRPHEWLPPPSPTRATSLVA